MRSLRKNPKATNRTSGRPHGGSGGMQDAASDKLAKLGRQSGNASIKDQLSNAEGRRDDLLQFGDELLVERLLFEFVGPSPARLGDRRDQAVF